MSSTILIVEFTHTTGTPELMSRIVPAARVARLVANPPLSVFSVMANDSSSAFHLLSQLALRDDVKIAYMFVGSDGFTFGDRQTGEIIAYLPPQ